MRGTRLLQFVRGAVMFLTTEELVALTGKQKPTAQRRVLDYLGIVPMVRKDKTLVVLRSQLELAQSPEPRRPQVKRTNGPTAQA
jgi:hypothetical protein